MKPLLCLASCLALLPLPAGAALFRAYLSLNGADTNPCTLAEPCRLLPAALAVIEDGGEIWMLDSANYNAGPVTVSVPVTVVAVPGVLGSLVAAGGNALDIATAKPVTLRNVLIRPLAGSEMHKGISMPGDGALTLERCDVSGFSTGEGLRVAAGAHLVVNGGVFRGNGVGVAVASGAKAHLTGITVVGGTTGIDVTAGASPTKAVVVERSVVSSNATGIRASAAQVSVKDSVLESNSAYGLQVTGATGLPAGYKGEASVSDSVVTGNGVGLAAMASGRLVLGGNTIVGNGAGVLALLPTDIAASAGNNVIRANGTNLSGAGFGTFAPQ